MRNARASRRHRCGASSHAVSWLPSRSTLPLPLPLPLLLALVLSLLLLAPLAPRASAKASASSSSSASDLAPSPTDFKVHSVARSVDLGGSVHRYVDVHTIQHPKRTQGKPKARFYLAVDSRDATTHLSHIECTAKYGVGFLAEQRAILDVRRASPADLAPSAPSTSSDSTLFYLDLPRAWVDAEGRAYAPDPEKGDGALPDITLTCEHTLLHAATPVPEEVGQTQEQFLVWQHDAAPRSVYGADKARVKVKAPHPKILSYSVEPAGSDDEATKSGSTITFGPYSNVAPELSSSASSRKRARVHYLYNSPVISAVSLRRHVEVSHWGDNLGSRDEVWLRNDGARLKGHFSRIEHQLASYYKRDDTHVLTNLVVHLPPGAKDPYFVDQIGNVSTSHFRASPASPQHVATPAHLLSAQRASVLELRPRYPLLGGWNYTFSLGWDHALSAGGWARRVGVEEARREVAAAAAGSEADDAIVASAGRGERYSVAVPLFVAVTDVAVDEVVTRVVLPEGARDVRVYAPFELDSVTHSTYHTYLDTRVGRASVELRKRNASDRHAAPPVVVRYSLAAGYAWVKVGSVAASVATVLGVVGLARRYDAKIG